MSAILSLAHFLGLTDWGFHPVPFHTWWSL